MLAVSDPKVPVSACRFCGTKLGPRPPGHREHRFCSAACRSAQNNLRLKRGAQIYDLLCEWKRSYKNRHLLTEISQQVAGWLEDDAVRKGETKKPKRRRKANVNT